MKIALYFGSFNPIHIGHLIIANHIAQEKLLIDQLWLVVSPENPLKQQQHLLNDYARLHLVNIAIQNNPLLKSCDVEFKLPKPSYTINTLTYLAEKYPQHQFTIVMGSDSYSNLPKWKNYETILKNYPIIVYPRANVGINFFPNSNTIIVKAPLLDISATYIRTQIAASKSIQYLVTDEVKTEIESNSYYKKLP